MITNVYFLLDHNRKLRCPNKTQPGEVYCPFHLGESKTHEKESVAAEASATANSVNESWTIGIGRYGTTTAATTSRVAAAAASRKGNSVMSSSQRSNNNNNSIASSSKHAYRSKRLKFTYDGRPDDPVWWWW